MSYLPDDKRYEKIEYRNCGSSGLKLPPVSLGLWHNFGHIDDYSKMQSMIRCAFDSGINHFDLANNYGPPPGSAEVNFGRMLSSELKPFRDEMIISTKAGYTMWEGPYGDGGSRKYLLASLDQSLSRMGLDYVDIFYHHRPVTDTPLEESMGALASAVHSGKALYVGLSNYPADRAREAFHLLREMGTHCLIHQPRYNLIDRWVEADLLALLESEGVGGIAFSPLAQGLLSEKYVNGVPSDSRVGAGSPFLDLQSVNDTVDRATALAKIARERGQSLAQMAVQWVLRKPAVTSALIGASRPEQIKEIVGCLTAPSFSDEELRTIDTACGL
ncbi:MAG: aldo/keto reductase [Coraliomargaritaceae bacterium]